MASKSGGNKKRPRPRRTSSGARKNRAGKNLGRRDHSSIVDPAVHSFMKRQAQDRWPTEESLSKAHQYSIDDKKKKRQRSQGKIKPMQVGFTLLDMVIDKGHDVEKLLVAASLKVKRVRRYPGYVLIKTYNLKNRPIEII